MPVINLTLGYTLSPDEHDEINQEANESHCAARSFTIMYPNYNSSFAFIIIIIIKICIYFSFCQKLAMWHDQNVTSKLSQDLARNKTHYGM